MVGDDGDHAAVPQPPLLDDSIQQLAMLALNLSALDWHDLGKQQQQQQHQQHLAVAESLDDATERIVALLLVRIVAVLLAAQQQQQQLENMRQKEEQEKSDDKDKEQNVPQKKKFPRDYSTTTLCRAVLPQQSSSSSSSSSTECCSWPIAAQQQNGGNDCDDSRNNNNNNEGTAALITTSVLSQLRQYVRVMLLGYNDLPFHNFHHCFHVVLSANKLLDLMLHVNQHDNSKHGKKHGKRRNSNNNNTAGGGVKTYGLRSNPTALLALLFAALIHDVGHSGVNNRQRVAELGDDLALRYNDQSIHENYSLHVAFDELQKPAYAELRRCMFPDGDVSYRAFRKLVIHVVLATDLTSPERLQLSSSMFQEAYPDYFNNDDEDIVNINNGDEYKFADGLDHDNVDMDDDPRLYYDDEAGGGAAGYDAYRRASLRSMGSMPRAVVGGTAAAAYNIESSRRGSVNSVASDITMDSYTLQVKYRHVEQLNQKHKKNSAGAKHVAPGYHIRAANNDDDYGGDNSRRYSMTSVGDHSEGSEGDSMLLHARYVPKAQPILSNSQRQQQLLRQDDSDSLGGSGTGVDGKALPIQERAHSMLDDSVKSLNSGSNFDSVANDSMRLTQQRKEGRPVSRQKQVLPAARLPRRTRRASTGDNLLNTSSKIDHHLDDHDDDSLSITPPSSEDEMDGFVVTGISLAKSTDDDENMVAPAKSRHYSDAANDIDRGLRRTKSTDDDELVIASIRSQQKHGVAAAAGAAAGLGRSSTRPIRSNRRASTGNYNPSRFGRAISGQKIIEEEGPADLNDSYQNMDWSPPNDDAPPAPLLPPPGYFRKHLGIRRSMDFSGEALEQYSKSTYGGASSVFSEGVDTATGGEGGDGGEDVDDEPNELRMTVVIEVFLKVADVAHWFQDWHVMVRFNSWLFRELCMAHASGRGFDPRSSWFDNQIKAMEQYVLPLADQFCHLGVLTPELGASFPTAVERNRTQWMDEGYEITQSLTTAEQKEEGLAETKNKES
jgi:ABC-type nickel/cobalt efflux system permease component RcnA